MKKVKDFLERKSNLKKIIIIYWPTWCWKTSLSINIAKEINSEIISTDSRQIFKYMNIWTWKILENEKEDIKHHMINIISPNEKYSVWEFKKEAENIINKIHKNRKIPILCWWTGLYIDSLIYDFDIPKIPADEKLRNKLEKDALKYWNNYVYNKLSEIDPEYAKVIHPNNLRYVIRAIEVKILTWKSKLDFKKEKELKYDTLFLTPYKWDREELYSNINIRIQNMFDIWLVKEIEDLLSKWYSRYDFWMKSIWYKEVIDFLNKKISLEDCINEVKQKNRNYAKRQLTWFRKYGNSKS